MKAALQNENPKPETRNPKEIRMPKPESAASPVRASDFGLRISDFNPGNALSAAARRRLLSRRAEPLFFADWDRALFIHYEVDAAALQRAVPFALDLREGRAYVSLVA